MLATSPSPSLSACHHDPTAFSPRHAAQYEQSSYAAKSASASASRSSLNDQSASSSPPPAPRKSLFTPPDTSSRPRRYPSSRSLDNYAAPPPPRATMVDAGTQYSPPGPKAPSPPSTHVPTPTIAHLQLSEKEELKSRALGRDDRAAPQRNTSTRPPDATSSLPKPSGTPGQGALSQGKRSADGPAAQSPPAAANGDVLPTTDVQSPVKKHRPDAPPARIMPLLYQNCNTRDLVVLISSMLMELIRYNDAIPLREGQLTRFHSRAPPGISVLDYLQRLTTHATLSPPILLSVVYYIDRLCALYPAFTISSLTVHRFLITSATVASKGLSDSFWTNKTYARVGGVSMKELALLELEFLTRMEWRIVPKPEVLVDYYKSLIERSDQYQLEDE
ncbi:Pho80p cyclin [Knufia peltigerae]|uniref:Pho80p cyclin n=1 Tax=Knufia peltigerae TaxID=1002370 RepID=A0AA38YCJ6_9EURO|nr:Pho80p cyclin [Knufia peltigerae]